MNKLMTAIIPFVIMGLTLQSAHATQYFYYDTSSVCVDCVKVEPNPFAHYGNSSLNGIPIQYGAYQVHYLKAGEQPTYFDYNCWGCTSIADYAKIFDEAGLWYYPK